MEIVLSLIHPINKHYFTLLNFYEGLNTQCLSPKMKNQGSYLYIFKEVDNPEMIWKEGDYWQTIDYEGKTEYLMNTRTDQIQFFKVVWKIDQKSTITFPQPDFFQAYTLALKDLIGDVPDKSVINFATLLTMSTLVVNYSVDQDDFIDFFYVNFDRAGIIQLRKFGYFELK